MAFSSQNLFMPSSSRPSVSSLPPIAKTGGSSNARLSVQTSNPNSPANIWSDALKALSKVVEVEHEVSGLVYNVEKLRKAEKQEQSQADPDQRMLAIFKARSDEAAKAKISAEGQRDKMINDLASKFNTAIRLSGAAPASSVAPVSPVAGTSMSASTPRSLDPLRAPAGQSVSSEDISKMTMALENANALNTQLKKELEDLKTSLQSIKDHADRQAQHLCKIEDKLPDGIDGYGKLAANTAVQALSERLRGLETPPTPDPRLARTGNITGPRAVAGNVNPYTASSTTAKSITLESLDTQLSELRETVKLHRDSYKRFKQCVEGNVVDRRNSIADKSADKESSSDMLVGEAKPTSDLMLGGALDIRVHALEQMMQHSDGDGVTRLRIDHNNEVKERQELRDIVADIRRWKEQSAEPDLRSIQQQMKNLEAEDTAACDAFERFGAEITRLRQLVTGEEPLSNEHMETT